MKNYNQGQAGGLSTERGGVELNPQVTYNMHMY